MPTIIVDYKNKREEKILHAFLQSLNIGFYSEEDGDKDMVKAYKKIKARNEVPVVFNPAKLKRKQK